MFILFFFLPNMTSHHKKKYSYSAATGHAQVIGFQIKGPFVYAAAAAF